MKLITELIILTLVCFSCNANDATPSNKPMPASQPNSAKTEKPLIQIDQLLSNEGFINIPLNIVEQRNKDGYLVNKIQAMSKNDTIELIVSLKEGIPAGLMDGTPENKFLADGIIFESTGPKSGRLLTALAQKYEVNSGKLTMKSKQIFTCANLNETAVDYQSGTSIFKIFLQGETEVAELYINFDFKNSTISLNEKDPQYRDALINIMKK